MNYIKRAQRLQETLQLASCDAVLIDDKTNIFYLTGLELSAGQLLVHKHGVDLFVDNRYLELCQKLSPFNVRPIDKPKFEEQLASPEYSFILTLAFDSEATTYNKYKQLINLTQTVSSARPDLPLALIPLDAPLKILRAIKDKSEIEILAAAAELGSKGFDFVCSILKEGITEREIAIELEIFWKRQGSQSVAFDPIIAFGKNSSMPHYRAGNTKLKSGDIILIDIGVNYQHYHSDMTRMAFFGQPNQQLIEVHDIVAKAQAAALKLCQPGTTLGALDDAARQVIAAHGYGPNFTHSLGHGIGLDIHEFPTIRNAPPMNSVCLEPGMVITIEPGIYLPDIGGVRIEDSILITKDGYQNLTQRNIKPIYLGIEPHA